MNASSLWIEGKEVVVCGLWPRVARLRAEYHESIDEPERFIVKLKASMIRADILSFVQPVAEEKPIYKWMHEPDAVAILRVESFEHWWNHQVSYKIRNRVKQAWKKKVEVREVRFDDELAAGIHAIYSARPIIQGMPSKHFGKDLETLKSAHATFLDQSVFVGAYFEGALIGFIKMVLEPTGRSASIMQVITIDSHWDKSPTNALLAKAIEVCAGRGIQWIQYGVWSRRGLGDFKKRHGFVRAEVPRFLIPLNVSGRCALALYLHRTPASLVPSELWDACVELRSRWYAYRFKLGNTRAIDTPTSNSQ